MGRRPLKSLQTARNVANPGDRVTLLPGVFLRAFRLLPDSPNIVAGKDGATLGINVLHNSNRNSGFGNTIGKARSGEGIPLPSNSTTGRPSSPGLRAKFRTANACGVEA